jgi:GNAT superfamily N-acetyltransferase
MTPANIEKYMDDIVIEGPLYDQSATFIPILRMLPDWFGLEAAILEYERAISPLPAFLARTRNGVLGFLSLKQHSAYSAEILVMAVRPEAHRRGIGRALVVAAETQARQMGIEYVQVKTLGPSRPDEQYARTRTFYEALGYRPLEEFSRIWDENNPCLILVKRL